MKQKYSIQDSLKHTLLYYTTSHIIRYFSITNIVISGRMYLQKCTHASTAPSHTSLPMPIVGAMEASEPEEFEFNFNFFIVAVAVFCFRGLAFCFCFGYQRGKRVIHLPAYE